VFWIYDYSALWVLVFMHSFNRPTEELRTKSST
jgi:hypothetical protein